MKKPCQAGAYRNFKRRVLISQEGGRQELKRGVKAFARGTKEDKELCEWKRACVMK